MGSITYDFLNNSFLFHQASIENKFAKYTNKQVEDEIERYLEFVTDNSDTIEKEIGEIDSDLKIFSSTKNHPINFLSQTVFYLDQFIIQDPLINHSVNQTLESKEIGQHVGYIQSEIEKSDVAKTCSYLKKITPLIAANQVKLFPISDYVRSKWSGQLHYAAKQYKGILPKEIEEFYWKNVKLKNLHSNGTGGYYLNPDEGFGISRAIHVSFGEENLANGNMYYLTKMLLSPPDENNIAKLEMFLPKESPAKEEFETWVTQSINSSAINHYSETVKEIELSSQLGTMYLTNEQIRSDLLRINGDDPDKTIENFSLETFLNYEIPYLENIDLNKLMELKEFDGDVFANFRIELQRNLRALRSLDDPKIMKEKIESMYHEFYVVQVNNVNQKVQQFKRQLTGTALISLASIIPAVASSGFSLFGLLVAGAKGYKDYNKYYEEAKNNPAFLFWKSKKKSR